MPRGRGGYLLRTAVSDGGSPLFGSRLITITKTVRRRRLRPLRTFGGLRRRSKIASYTSSFCIGQSRLERVIRHDSSVCRRVYDLLHGRGSPGPTVYTVARLLVSENNSRRSFAVKRRYGRLTGFVATAPSYPLNN